jgi:hypothetical protein
MCRIYFGWRREASPDFKTMTSENSAFRHFEQSFSSSSKRTVKTPSMMGIHEAGASADINGAFTIQTAYAE